MGSAERVVRSKPVRVDQLGVEILTDLGLRLIAEREGDTVNGHISTYRKAAGLPFFRIFRDGAVTENDHCEMCDTDIPRAEAHDCCEVVLYERPTAQVKARLAAIIQNHRPEVP